MPEALTAALARALGEAPTLGVLMVVAAGFAAGGLVKGLLGVGLPLISVPLLALVIPSPKAVALMGVPVLLSNVWQSAAGGHTRYALRRFAWVIVPMMITTALSVRLLLNLPVRAVNVMMAATVLLAVALIAWQPTLNIDARSEKRWGAAVGALSGALGSVSSVMGPMLVSYLVALRLSREQFVGCISVLNLSCALPLFASMAVFGLMGWPELLVSVAAMLPVALGMTLGTRLRQHVSEPAFRRLLLAFLTLIALVLLLRNTGLDTT